VYVNEYEVRDVSVLVCDHNLQPHAFALINKPAPKLNSNLDGFRVHTKCVIISIYGQALWTRRI